jgi:hypothetical protein
LVVAYERAQPLEQVGDERQRVAVGSQVGLVARDNKTARTGLGIDQRIQQTVRLEPNLLGVVDDLLSCVDVALQQREPR